MARILVVDDEPKVRDVLKRILETEGHDVAEAANGADGLERLQEWAADLVIADLFMPVMDGLEFINKTRQSFPNLRVIAISGSVYEQKPQFLEIASRMGGVKTLAKPFESEAVLAIVTEMLAEGEEST